MVDFKKLRPYRVEQVDIPSGSRVLVGYRVTTTPEYGKCPELPVKKGILTGQLVFSTHEQAVRKLVVCARKYFSM